jgi:hypothetical protein
MMLELKVRTFNYPSRVQALFPEELFGWTSGKNETRDDFRAMGEIKSRPEMRVRLKRLAVYIRRMNVSSSLRDVPEHTELRVVEYA